MSEIHIKAVYENGVLKPEHPLNISESTKVHITIHQSFSEYIEQFGAPEAKEEIDVVLDEIRHRKWYADSE